jgi:glycosyltransferase involved in cell wall biosynthesis
MRISWAPSPCGGPEPSYFEQCDGSATASLCASHIELCGPYPDVPAILAAADAFVLDSFHFEKDDGVASMEALCAGLPVVRTEVGGAREQVGENGHRGFVVGNPSSDSDAMDWRKFTRAVFVSGSPRDLGRSDVCNCPKIAIER